MDFSSCYPNQTKYARKIASYFDSRNAKRDNKSANLKEKGSSRTNLYVGFKLNRANL